MSTISMSRRNFVAGASAMALGMAAVGTALAEEGGMPEGMEDMDMDQIMEMMGGEGGMPEGGGGGMGGGTKDIEAARAAAAAEGRTFGYAGVGDWLGEPEDVPVARTIDDFDIVVIGGGHAGAQAMLAASEMGAKVALCEKNFAMTFLGEDFAAWNAQFNIDAGFAEYNLGEVIEEFVNRGGGKSSQEVVSAYVTNSGECMDNMIACMKDVVENDDMKAAYHQLIDDVLFTDEYTAGGEYEEDVDSSYYTYDVTPAGKIIIQAMFDPDKVHELTDGIDWAAIPVDADCEKTEEGYRAGYAPLYDELADFYDNNNQCLNHTEYPKWPGTKTWATTVQFMGHFHGREGHDGVAQSSIIGNVQMACLTKAIQNGSEIFMGYKGYQLVQDEDGTVTGVICYDGDADEYVQFNCKAVVSCGGGYVQNSEMCWALLNELMEKYERCGGLKDDFNGGGMAASADGSSTKMMCWAGAFVEPSPRGHMSMGGGPQGVWGSNCHLWLDGDMNRFCNEGLISAAATACSRKTGTCYGVIGGDYLKHIAACGLEHGGPNFGRPEYIMDLMYDMEMGEVDSQITVTGSTTAERMSGRMMKASSLESLAGLLGIEDVDGFVAAVNAYNELCYGCQDGTYKCDPQFGKHTEAMVPIEGPLYYGFSGSLGESGQGPTMVTMSGVMTDKNLNVVDIDGAPIPGLFAAGNDLGGRYGTGYCTPAAGNSIGMACTHGRVAGKSAAAYLGL